MKKSKKQPANHGNGKNLISRIVMSLDSNVQFSTKITRHTKKQKSMSHSKGKNKTTERQQKLHILLLHDLRDLMCYKKLLSLGFWTHNV